jgi:hypothetical protein
MLNRCIVNNFKKIVERDKVVALNWEPAEFVKRRYEGIERNTTNISSKLSVLSSKNSSELTAIRQRG